MTVLSAVPERRARLLRLVSSFADASCCDRAGDVPASCGAAVLVADTTAMNLTALGSTLDDLRRDVRVVLVVLVAGAGPANLHATLTAAPRIRVVDSVAVDWYDIAPLTLAAIRRADSLLCAEHIVDGVRAFVPAWLLPFVEFCAGRTGVASNVATMVEHAGLKRRTLDSRLHRAGLPTAEALLGWCRVLHAAWRLDRSTDSVERIALANGLTSASALRNYYRRYAGLSPIAARARGGFAFLLERLRAEVEVSREPLHRQRAVSEYHR